MPELWGFSDKRVAEILRKVARERRLQSKDNVTTISQEPRPINAGSYIIHLDEELPPATVDEDGVVTLGEALGYIYRRQTITPDGSDSQWSQETSYQPVSSELTPVRHNDGSCNKRRIYNSSETLYSVCSYVEAVQDTFGDLYASSEVLETTLTTTTA
jgi:hypothetical protein